MKPIPEFKNEDEEREFWATHDVTEYFDWSKATGDVHLAVQRIQAGEQTYSLEEVKRDLGL